MTYTKTLFMLTASFAICTSCFCMDQEKKSDEDVINYQTTVIDAIENYENKGEKVRKKTYGEIEKVLKEKPEALLDKDFFDEVILSKLYLQDPQKRGLIYYLLFRINQQIKLKNPKSHIPINVLKVMAKNALNEKLKFARIMEESACNSEIRVLGEYDLGDERNTGIAIAITEPGIFSKYLLRKDLDEHYLILQGNIVVALNYGTIDEPKWLVMPGKTGDHIKIPRNIPVQFKNVGEEPLIMLVPTNPPYNVVAKKVGYDKVETILDQSKAYFKDKK